MRGLRIGVIGVGHMGSRHAAKVAALRDAGAEVTLAGVADIDAARARRVGAAHRVRAVTDARELFEDIDAAVIAVPTLRHYDLVRDALEAGLDVLVEKPIAATLEQGEAILEELERRGSVLHVGHLEWHNGAMGAIRPRIREPRFVEAHRIGSFPDRSLDVDVVSDLMIHDLDILQQLLGEEPERIEAIGVPVLTDKIDIANARIEFPSGCVADLTASRVSAVPLRKMRFFQRDGYFSVDFLERSASIYRRPQAAEDGEGGILVEELGFPQEDALLTQLRAFVDAVQKREAPMEPARNAVGALRTALRVVGAVRAPGAAG